jgi:hypothetical protein
MRVPDYVEPTIGWRSWRLVRNRGEIRLASLCGTQVWTPRRELVARCSLHGGHTAPAEHCSCGIYAAREFAIAAGYLNARRGMDRGAFGRVSLWGSVVECELGWRGSHAYPERIYVPTGNTTGNLVAEASDLAAALSVYGVPVQLIDNDLSGHRLTIQVSPTSESADRVTLLPLALWTRRKDALNRRIPPEAA